MKNLTKLLLTLGISLLSLNNAKAQAIYAPAESIPLSHVPKDFRNYQNKTDIDTMLVDTTNLNEVNDFKSEVLYLDINKDSECDVIEMHALKGNRFSGYEKTPHPWRYLFLKELEDEKGDTAIYYDAWLDLFIDGLNGNEIREADWEEIELRRKNSIILYEPRRKVAI